MTQRYPQRVTKASSFLAGLFLLSLSFLGGAVPASADAALVRTDPSDGALLENAPDSLTLSFNSTLLDGIAEVALSNSAGELVTGVIAESAGTDVIAFWPADLPGDTYKVAYRIVSEDGHPVTGSFSFSYPDAATVTAEPEVTTMDAPTAEPTTTEQSETESSSMLVWVLGFVALALVVAGYFIWRKRST